MFINNNLLYIFGGSNENGYINFDPIMIDYGLIIYKIF